jgi:hypothetical protein
VVGMLMFGVEFGGFGEWEGRGYGF